MCLLYELTFAVKYAIEYSHVVSSLYNAWALLIPIELALCYGSRVSKAVIGCYFLADHF